jgi:hypothetical protein
MGIVFKNVEILIKFSGFELIISRFGVLSKRPQ